jgi:hypothetical protein
VSANAGGRDAKTTDPQHAAARQWLDRHHIVVYGLVAAVGTALFTINLARAPDFDIDEVLYTFAAQRIGSHNSISWSANPVLVHPPLYFLSISGWLNLTGDLGAPLLTALRAARYFNIFFCVGDALLTASLAKIFTRRTGGFRAYVMLMSGLLVAFDPFLQRFGRSVLIEPMAVFLGMLAIRVSWALRDKPSRMYVPVYGTLVGIAVLCKEPAIFVAAAPLAAAILRWNRREVLRNLGAMAVAAFVFSSFVAYCLIERQGSQLVTQTVFSFLRLLGIAQVSGLNRPNVSPIGSFKETFGQYSSGYILLATGGISLLAAVLRLRRRIRDDEVACMVCGFGILSFVFLVYSIFIGQSNEQLTVYAVPASVLLTFLGSEFRPGGNAAPARRGHASPARQLRRIAAARGVVVAVALLAGVLSWAAYMATSDDTATSKVEHYIETALPTCAPINSTGESFRWAATMRSHPVYGFGSGLDALAHDIHVYLVSPKDSRFYYGASSPQLTAWIESNGHEVYSAPSHTYDSIQVWLVGQPQSPVGSNPATCGDPNPPVATRARATVFLLCLGAALSAVLAAALMAEILWRRSDGAAA